MTISEGAGESDPPDATPHRGTGAGNGGEDVKFFYDIFRPLGVTCVYPPNTPRERPRSVRRTPTTRLSSWTRNGSEDPVDDSGVGVTNELRRDRETGRRQGSTDLIFRGP